MAGRELKNKPLAWIPTVLVKPNKSGQRGAARHGNLPYVGIGLGRKATAM